MTCLKRLPYVVSSGLHLSEALEMFRKLCFGRVFESSLSKCLPKQSLRNIWEKKLTRKLSFGNNRMIRKLYQMKVFVNMEIFLTSKNYQMKDPPY